MTRVNLVHARELADQHAMAELREIPRLWGAVARSAAHWQGTDREFIAAKVPPTFRLGTGHVSFFYDKLGYITRRIAMLRAELLLRGYNLSSQTAGLKLVLPSHFDPDLFYKDYRPDGAALLTSRQRLAEKLAAKPNFYRFTPTYHKDAP